MKPTSCLLLALLHGGAVLAQTAPAAPAAEPSAQQIIDALKPRPADAPAVAEPAAPPRKKMRNLTVEAAPAEAGSGAGAAVPAGAMASPARPAQQASISLAIQFAYNSDQVQPGSMQTLASLARAMQSPELSKLRFRLEGHTDGTGAAAYNVKLSEQRAEQVRKVLIANNISPSRLVTEGKGASELLNAAEPAAAENRRVRIVSLEP